MKFKELIEIVTSVDVGDNALNNKNSRRAFSSKLIRRKFSSTYDFLGFGKKKKEDE